MTVSGTYSGLYSKSVSIDGYICRPCKRFMTPGGAPEAYWRLDMQTRQEVTEVIIYITDKAFAQYVKVHIGDGTSYTDNSVFGDSGVVLEYDTFVTISPSSASVTTGRYLHIVGQQRLDFCDVLVITK